MTTRTRWSTRPGTRVPDRYDLMGRHDRRKTLAYAGLGSSPAGLG